MNCNFLFIATFFTAYWLIYHRRKGYCSVVELHLLHCQVCVVFCEMLK